MDDSIVPVFINVQAFENMVENLKIIVSNIGKIEKHFKNNDMIKEAYLLQKNRQYLINMEHNLSMLLIQIENNKLITHTVRNTESK